MEVAGLSTTHFMLIFAFWLLAPLTWRLTEQARQRHWIICHYSAWIDLAATIATSAALIRLFSPGPVFAFTVIIVCCGLTVLMMTVLVWIHRPCQVDCRYGPRKKRKKRTASSKVRWRWLPDPARA